MHHSFHISVPPSYTSKLLEELRELEEVVGVAVQRGASVKPPGDVVTVQALNRGSDRVLALVDSGRERGEISVTSSLVESTIDPAHESEIAGDVDEAPWEDIETALRHHGQMTVNFVLTMALGGVIAACGLLLSTSTQATALVAAAVIAPGFEPLGKLPLGLVLRRGSLMARGVRSAVVGYVALMVGAAITTLALDAGGYALPARLLANSQVHELTHPNALTLAISAAGAVAGVTMLTAQRSVLLPGALIALQLIPAAGLVGAALALGEGDAALRALGRMGIDVGMVAVAGVVVFGAKQRFVHRRKPVV